MDAELLEVFEVFGRNGFTIEGTRYTEYGMWMSNLFLKGEFYCFHIMNTWGRKFYGHGCQSSHNFGPNYKLNAATGTIDQSSDWPLVPAIEPVLRELPRWTYY